MSQMHVEMSAVIEARPEDVYAVMSDYRVGHAAILPKPYFVSMTIEEGGQGAGTVARVKMKVMGFEANYRMVVSEPEPGRVLVESDPGADVATIFTFDSLDAGSKTRLTIATQMRVSPGIKGLLEKLFNPPIMRRIYKKELRQVAEYVAAKRNGSLSDTIGA